MISAAAHPKLTLFVKAKAKQWLCG